MIRVDVPQKEIMTEPQDFLEYIIKGIVDNPDDVKVTKTVDDMGVLLTLDVNPEDMGQVIGRQGATAKSIRTLVRVCGMKSQARVNVKINEPNKEGEEVAE
tara:strand:- start:19630 stop:19932 length:303 start_codon:yes stop_codon:yes gene_type:complete